MISYILTNIFSLILPIDLPRIMIISMGLLNLHVIFPQTRSIYATCNELEKHNLKNVTMISSFILPGLVSNINMSSDFITKSSYDYVYNENNTLVNSENKNITSENISEASIYIQNITTEQNDYIESRMNNTKTIIIETVLIKTFGQKSYDYSYIPINLNNSENSNQTDQRKSLGELTINQTITEAKILLDKTLNKLVLYFSILT